MGFINLNMAIGNAIETSKRTGNQQLIVLDLKRELYYVKDGTGKKKFSKNEKIIHYT